MPEEQRLFIGGSWVAPDNGFYEVIDPATEGVVGLAPEASRNQVHAAAAAAREAFGAWSRTPAEERAAVLARAADHLEAPVAVPAAAMTLPAASRGGPFPETRRAPPQFPRR